MGCGQSKEEGEPKALADEKPIRDKSWGHQARPESEGKPFSKDSRILIIGGGPSGIHMAHLLKQKGFTKVKVLEREGAVGGKSHTLFHDDTPEVPHEMGTCYMHAGYHRLCLLADSYQMGPRIQIGGDRFDKFDIHSPALNKEKDKAAGKEEADPDRASPVMDWLFSEIERRELPNFLFFLPDYLQALPLADAVLRYNQMHKSLFGDFLYTLPPRLDDETMEKLDMSFMEFIKKHRFEPLVPIFLMANSGPGYGHLDRLPAFYGLWWNVPELLNTVLKREPIVRIFKKNGFQTLWRKIVERDEIEVVLNAEVVSVDRNLENPDQPIKVKALLGKEGEGEGEREEKEFEADFLIMACPLGPALEFLKDQQEEEVTYFSALKPVSLVSNFTKTEVIKEDEQAITYFPEKLFPQYIGKMYGMRNSERATHPEREPPKDKRYCVAYQYYDDYQKTIGKHEELKETITEELTNFGFKDIEIMKQCVWYYSPRWTQEDLKKGYPWKVLDMQGKHRTWYAGSSVCFESVEDVMCYNHLLFHVFNLDH